MVGMRTGRGSGKERGPSSVAPGRRPLLCRLSHTPSTSTAGSSEICPESSAPPEARPPASSSPLRGPAVQRPPPRCPCRWSSACSPWPWSAARDFAEVYVERTHHHRRACSKRSASRARRRAWSQGVGVRVISGAKVGYAYSDDLDDEALLPRRAHRGAHRPGRRLASGASTSAARRCPSYYRVATPLADVDVAREDGPASCAPTRPRAPTTSASSR